MQNNAYQSLTFAETQAHVTQKLSGKKKEESYMYYGNITSDSRIQNDPLESEKCRHQTTEQNVQASLDGGHGDYTNHKWLDRGHCDRLAIPIGQPLQTRNEHSNRNVQAHISGSRWSDGSKGLSNTSNSTDINSQSTLHMHGGSHGLSDVECTTSHMTVSSNGMNSGIMIHDHACTTSQGHGTSPLPHNETPQSAGQLYGQQNFRQGYDQGITNQGPTHLPPNMIPQSAGQLYGQQNGGQGYDQGITNQGPTHLPQNMIYGQSLYHLSTFAHGQPYQASEIAYMYHHMNHPAQLNIGCVPHMSFGTNGFPYGNQFVPGGYYYGAHLPPYPPMIPPACYMGHQYQGNNGYQQSQWEHQGYAHEQNQISYHHNQNNQPAGQGHSGLEDLHGNLDQTTQLQCCKLNTNIETKQNNGTPHSLPYVQLVKHQHISESADYQYNGYIQQNQNALQQPHKRDDNYQQISMQTNQTDHDAVTMHASDVYDVQLTQGTVHQSSRKHQNNGCQSVTVHSTMSSTMTTKDDSKSTTTNCYMNGECGYQVDDQVRQVNDHDCQNDNHVCQKSDTERAPIPLYQTSVGGEESKLDTFQDNHNATQKSSSTSTSIKKYSSKHYYDPGHFMNCVMGISLSVSCCIEVSCQSYHICLMKGQDSVPWECWEDKPLLQEFEEISQNLDQSVFLNLVEHSTADIMVVCSDSCKEST